MSEPVLRLPRVEGTFLIVDPDGVDFALYRFDEDVWVDGFQDEYTEEHIVKQCRRFGFRVIQPEVAHV